MATSLTRVGAGAVLSVATGLAAWLYIGVAGQPFGNWGWATLTFCLLIAAVLTLTILAAASSPFEPRLLRWRVAGDPLGRGAIDPLAIGYQMDLAASESNPPRRVTSESRWLWVALVPAISALVLGATLARSSDGVTPRMLISDRQAIAVANQALERTVLTEQPFLLGYVVTTPAEASRHFDGAVPFAASEPDRLVFIVFFTTSREAAKEPSSHRVTPGPSVALDAEAGVVLWVGDATYADRDR
jgi:hypothetical protein